MVMTTGDTFIHFNVDLIERKRWRFSIEHKEKDRERVCVLFGKLDVKEKRRENGRWVLNE